MTDEENRRATGSAPNYAEMTDSECCETGYHRRRGEEACACGYKEGRGPRTSAATTVDDARLRADAEAEVESLQAQCKEYRETIARLETHNKRPAPDADDVLAACMAQLDSVCTWLAANGLEGSAQVLHDERNRWLLPLAKAAVAAGEAAPCASANPILETIAATPQAEIDELAALDEAAARKASVTAEDEPHVCPGCHAVNAPCAPGCVDAEIARESEDRAEREDDDAGDSEPDDTSWIVARHNVTPKYLADVTCHPLGDVWMWTDDPAKAWPMSHWDAERYAFCSYASAHVEAALSVGPEQEKKT
jgi:hypothetical protein